MSTWRHTALVVPRLLLSLALLITLGAANIQFFLSPKYTDWQYERLRQTRAIPRDWPTASSKPIIEYLRHVHEELPGLTEKEQSHMADVRGLFDRVAVARGIAFLVVIGILVMWRLRGPAGSIGSLIVISALSAAALLLAGLGLLAANFDSIFDRFHSLFFTQGSWLFSSESMLIRLFPQAFWFGVARDLVILTVLESLLVAALVPFWAGASRVLRGRVFV